MIGYWGVARGLEGATPGWSGAVVRNRTLSTGLSRKKSKDSKRRVVVAVADSERQAKSCCALLEIVG